MNIASIYVSISHRTELFGEFNRPEDYTHESIVGGVMETLPRIQISPPQCLSTVRIVSIGGQFFPVMVIPESDELFVSRVETEGFNATGQGETEEEALENIKSAIELLLEEESNPGEDVPWPEDYQ